MDVLKIILTIIISLSWLSSQIIRIQFGNGLSLNILDIAVGGTSVMVVIWFISKEKLHLFFRDNIGKGILFFSSIAILSLLWNIYSLSMQQFIISGLYVIRWISYALLFLLIRESSNRYKGEIRKIVLIAGIVFLIIGYIQFFYYSQLRNLSYLGWDEHMYRLFSIFLDPNFSGIFLVLFLLFIVGKRLEMPLRPLTGRKLLLSVGIGFVSGALILTFSRTAFITLFFIFITFLSLIGKRRWIVIIVGIMLVSGIVLSQRFYIENLNIFRTFSSNARLESMKQAAQIFISQPVLGIGFNAYRYAQLRYGFRTQADIDASHADSGTDNSFLFILATTGILGFITYVALFVVLLRDVYIAFRKKRQMYAAVVFSSVVGLCIASIFTNALFFPPLMLWMWVLLGTMDYK